MYLIVCAYNVHERSIMVVTDVRKYIHVKMSLNDNVSICRLAMNNQICYIKYNVRATNITVATDVCNYIHLYLTMHDEVDLGCRWVIHSIHIRVPPTLRPRRSSSIIHLPAHLLKHSSSIIPPPSCILPHTLSHFLPSSPSPYPFQVNRSWP